MNPVSLVHLSPDTVRNLQARHGEHGQAQPCGKPGERRWALALLLFTASTALAFACLG